MIHNQREMSTYLARAEAAAVEHGGANDRRAQVSASDTSA